MAWIMMFLAIGCFLVPFLTKSFALGVFCMLLALVFVLISTVLLLSARVSAAARKGDILSPEELRVLRQQADRKRESAAKPDANSGTASGAASSSNGRAPPTAS